MTRRDILERLQRKEITAARAAELLRARPEPQSEVKPDDGIAVIGMAGRFPGAPDVHALWENVREGRVVIREVPRERWDMDRYFDPDPRAADKTYSRWGGFVDAIDAFDPLFFRISPREAELLDPQQRLFLQEAWHALEDAGYATRALDGARCSVYTGCKGADYQIRIYQRAGSPFATTGSYFFGGNDISMLPARIAYFLNLRGAAVPVNTACSSSLVALHLACESLRAGESSMAIAGGVELMTTPMLYMSLARAGALSPTGRCRPFDDDADGFVLGEGVCAFVLKPLSAALRDGDHVYGVIRGSGINQDGRSNGITAPSPAAQTELECAVYDRFGIDPDTISYVETHGTGTVLGDPIELEALTNAFRRYTQRRGFCAVGSIKANIGHAISAAGVAGVLKVLLAFAHREIPPAAGFARPNARIDFDGSPFFVNPERMEWTPPAGVPRRAAVSSFGFSGTNAHVVLDEPPAVLPRTMEEASAYLLPLSAKTRDALGEQVENLASWLDTRGAGVPLGDVSFTLAEGRTHFRHRRAVVARDADDLRAQLRGAARTHGALDPVADAYERGEEVDFTAFVSGRGWRRTPLPGYPFARERYWVDEPAAEVAPRHTLLQYVPHWTPVPLAAGARFAGNVLLVSGDEALRVALAAEIDGRVMRIRDGEHLPAGTFDAVVHAPESENVFDALLALTQGLLKSGMPQQLPLVHLYRVRGTVADAAHAAAAGFLASLVREDARFLPMVVAYDTGAARVVANELAAGRAFEVQYERGTRFEKTLVPAEPVSEASPLRERGVCIVTGGAGGIGAHLARHLARTRRARLVLAGRTRRDGRIDALLAELGDAIYVAADVTTESGVKAIVSAAHERFGAIHGLFHCAGTAGEGLIATTNRERVTGVIAPKVRGALLLDEALRGEPLDVFMLASSLAAASGGEGQCAYAYANAWLDAFASLREQRTVSIAWPLWADGGMQMRVEIAAALRETIGLHPLPTGVALEAFDDALRGNERCRFVLYGEGARIAAAPLRPQLARVGRKAVAADGDLVAEAERLVREALAEVTQAAPERIDRDAGFEEYGIDSIMVVNFTAALERTLGPLPKTLLFEHQSVGALAAHLAREHAGGLKPAAPPPRRSATARAQEPIAIIGMSGIYPGVRDLDAFWELLARGGDAVTEIPAGRWPGPDRFDPNPERALEGKIYCRWGGFLDDVDAFDPLFFNISPREAELMDPQERLFVQTAWAALEDAGYTRARLRARSGDVGVFAGVTTHAYQLFGPELWASGQHLMPSSSAWSLANRVSYLFNFTGPSMPVDTACSASLTAIHLACESIRRGECGAALAGGVNLYLHPSKYVGMCQLRMLSPSGRCRTFGAGADGFVPGEGVGAMLLKPLSAAERDHDRIRAVILGSAVNHGGRTHGFSVPSPNAQAALVSRALEVAGVEARSIGCIEAHGTGTALGDPIEIRGLAKAFDVVRGERFCSIGSVKTNIGHLESAAGVAGLTKLVLQFEHEQLAPSLHASEPNPDLGLDATPFFVQHALAPWPRTDVPRRAGISSFGAGGANAHVVVEEAPAVIAGRDDDSPQLLVLSARDRTRLREIAERLAEVFEREERPSLRATAYTLQTGREAMEERMAIRVTNAGEVAPRLRAWLAGEPCDDAGELARLWTSGEEVDWETLWSDPPRPVPLPSYPFARTRYWVPTPASGTPLHPVVHRRLDARRFESTFTGEEFFLRDHVLAGRRVLPGVTYLEIARAAGTLAHERPVRRVGSVVWMRPIAVEGEPFRFEVSVTPEVESWSAFRVTSGEGVVHVQGRVHFDGTPEPPRALDLDAIRARCTEWLDGAECYRQAAAHAVSALGLEAGPSLRVIREFRRNGAGEALAELVLPREVESDAAEYVLHPSLLDGALQTVLGLTEEIRSTTGVLHFPFALAEVEIFAPLPARVFAYATARESLKFDIVLADERGAVCVRLREFSVRSAPAAERTPAAPAISAGRRAEEIAPDLEQELVSLAKAVLKLEDIDPARDLHYYGFDSISLTELSDRISRRWNIEVLPTVFFEHQTLRAFAGHLRERTSIETPHAAMQVRAAATREPVAIVGIAGRMPGCEDLDAFWRALERGESLVGEVPRERWDWRAFYGDPAVDANRTRIRWGGFLQHVDHFDPLFFGISPREAELMDPQQRLFLTCAWEAIEDAGYAPSSFAGTRTAVFAGVTNSDYADLLRERLDQMEAQGPLGNTHCVLANRVSFLLDLRGPSEPVNTGCSSAMLAIHRAAELVADGRCDSALAGGVNVILNPLGMVFFNQAGVLSEDGCCRAFDAGANGTVRAEGVGVVLLKRLSDAVADGDSIYGVIRQTVENHGGRAPSLTAPNPNAQAELIVEAYERSGIDPSTISYVEAHGTGTRLGDPVEINGLLKAFRTLYARAGRPMPSIPACGIGSVKTNTGHLEPAAAMASLFKVLLALRHQRLVPNANFRQLNPMIRLDGTPFYVVDGAQPWISPPGVPRRAAISSFGMGGANGHMILEEYLDGAVPQPEGDAPQLVVLSAKSEERLDAAAARLHDHLQCHPRETALADLAFTLQTGRDAMEWRLAIVARDEDELRKALRAHVTGVRRALTGRARRNGDVADPITPAVAGLDALARLWVSGVEVDWRALHAGTRRRRVSLPPYPFARASYWVHEREQQPRQSPAAAGSEVVTYGFVWRPAPLSASGPVGSTLLIGADAATAAAFEDAGRIIAAETVELFLANVPSELPKTVVFVAGAYDPLAAVVQLVQAYAGMHMRKVLERIVFAHRGSEPEVVCAAGFARSLEPVLPNVLFTAVDLGDITNHARALRIEAGLRGTRGAASEVRFRDGQRFERRVVPLSLDEGSGVRLRERGRYLITGGAGGLGLIFARHLLRRFHASVILTGRSPSPEAAESLRAEGGEVLYVAADVCDAGAMRDAVRQAVTRFGGIDGVLHAAGVANRKPLDRKSLIAFEAAIAPKCTGTRVLDEVTRELGLDFFALFSSTSVLLGDLGQGDYAVGNRFLDAFAATRPGRTVSIQWPLWREGGMHLDDSTEAMALDYAGMAYLETADGLAAFERILASSETNVAVLVPRDRARVERFLGVDTNAAEASAGDVTRFENELAAVVCGMLKLDRATLDLDAPLTDFGFDSIQIARLVQRLNEEYEFLDLAPSVFFETRTLRALAARLTEEQRAVRKPAEHGTGDAELVVFRRGGRMLPSFWVHGSMGFAESLRPIADALGDDHPVYAFQARGHDGNRMPFLTVERMAAHYMSVMRRVQPSGPYVLGGYSFGGLVAFEIARQLLRTGLPVAGLFLIDTYPPAPEIHRMASDEGNLRTLRVLLANHLSARNGSPAIDERELDGVPPSLQPARIIEMLEQRDALPLPADDLFRLFRGALDVNDLATAAYAAYPLARLDGAPVTYFKATRGFERNVGAFDYLAPWTRVIESLRIVECPADHSSMLEGDSLSIIRGELLAALTGTGATAAAI